MASFYDPVCISFYYASAVMACVLTSLFGIYLSYHKLDPEQFMNIMVYYSILVVIIGFVTHLLIRRSNYYRQTISKSDQSSAVTFLGLSNSFEKISQPFWILVMTVTLTAITVRSVFFEIRPSFFDETRWINSINIGSNIMEFLGRSLGYFS